MTGFGKLFRTTAFKLSLAYLVVFAVGAGLVLGSVAWDVKNLIDQQTAQTVEAEINGLSEQYAQGGIWQLVESSSAGRCGRADRSISSRPPRARLSPAMSRPFPQGMLDRPGARRDRLSAAGRAGDQHHRALARIFAAAGRFPPARRP